MSKVLGAPSSFPLTTVTTRLFAALPRLLPLQATIDSRAPCSFRSSIVSEVPNIADTLVRNVHVPLFSTDEVISKIKELANYSPHHKNYYAMYSSIIGGITTDPTFMLIPLDDHMVHRGHGVFDTALIRNGYLYELDAHLDRLLRSAAMAKITPPMSRDELRSVLVATAAASNCRHGLLRYWLSAGPGGFDLTPSRQCRSSAFYAVAMQDKHKPSDEGGVVVTSSIPMKPPAFATMKSVNYLPNALSMMEAEEKGACAAIWVDAEGLVAEGPNMNVAFVSKDGELLMPAFDSILAGCTAKRALALAQELVEGGLLNGLSVRAVPVHEAKNAAEMMLLGSGIAVMPIVQWDDQQIGDGTVSST